MQKIYFHNFNSFSRSLYMMIDPCVFKGGFEGFVKLAELSVSLWRLDDASKRQYCLQIIF